MIILVFLKLFWWALVDFLNTKVGIITTGILVIICSVLYSHHLGVNAGKEQQNIKQKAEYQLALTKALKEQSDKQKQENEIALAVASSKVKVETVYIDRIKTVQKIVHDNKALQNKNCVIDSKTIEALNKLTEEVK
jgi:hypothetical protein